ncbi:MAG: C4-type zinc ribbon domain-containing protein [Paludibacteraceae bacterium]|nr:C4-type zinc ribbon domain-containing protein [Paludibacteraceae bacterium]
MAKKEEKELTIEEKLKALYELQQVDSKIDELRILAGELPQEVKDMGDEVEGLKTRLQNIENAIKECEMQISDHRVRMENANASIARYKEQQDNVRNNREYDNLNKEIEYQQLDIELSQKKIRNYTTEMTTKQEEKAKTIADIEERTFDLNQKRTELDSILQETKAETEALVIRSAELEKHIDDRLLTAFKRIRKNAHNGLAVVKVERDSCGGCHAKVPAQRQLDIRQRKKIIVCEFCGRILVDPEIDETNKKKK